MADCLYHGQSSPGPCPQCEREGPKKPDPYQKITVYKFNEKTKEIQESHFYVDECGYHVDGFIKKSTKTTWNNTYEFDHPDSNYYEDRNELILYRIKKQTRELEKLEKQMEVGLQNLKEFLDYLK